MKVSTLLLSVTLLLPEFASLHAAPPTPPAAANAQVEHIDGRAAVAHLANLRQRRAKAFAAATKRMEERGYRATDLVTVLRTTGTVANRRGNAAPNSIYRVEETFTSGEGEVVLWAYDDGDPGTWEGVIYAENYQTGSYATYDAQIDVSTENFNTLWEEQTSSGPYQPQDNYKTGALRKTPVALFASAALSSVPGGDIQLVQVDEQKVDDFIDCFLGRCMGVVFRCVLMGPGALGCAMRGCGVIALGCAIEHLT